MLSRKEFKALEISTDVQTTLVVVMCTGSLLAFMGHPLIAIFIELLAAGYTILRWNYYTRLVNEIVTTDNQQQIDEITEKVAEKVAEKLFNRLIEMSYQSHEDDIDHLDSGGSGTF